MAGSSAASSLYSGIFEKQDGANTPADERRTSGEEKVPADPAKETVDNDKDAGQAKESTNNAQVWSAALRFAPRKPSGSGRAKRPATSYLSAAFAGVMPAEEAGRSGASKIDGIQSSSSSTPVPAPAVEVPSALARRDIEVRALNLNTTADALGDLPLIDEPPSLTLPEEEIENDRALFRQRANDRGEGSSMYAFRSFEAGSDDDVNGFRSTVEGKRAKKKRRNRGIPGHRGGLSASLNMEVDYDVRVPNDFSAFKRLLHDRKTAEKRYKRSRHEEWDGDDQSEGESDEKAMRFAPPSSYRIDDGLNSLDEELDDKPYLSPPPLPRPMPPGPPPSRPPNVEASQPMTGEDAYLRRVALSKQAQGQGHEATVEQRPVDDFAVRAAAAAAIAARLGNIAKVAEAAPSVNTPTERKDPGTFAERLMARQGWRKGEALGAEGNKGILDPIMATKLERGKQKDDSAHPASNRGTIISALEDERRREERERYGEPSEVLLLQNMVSNDDEIDEDLPEEIASECGKHGFIKRVFIFPSASSDSADVRRAGRPHIFVRFTGMAGAWRCLKELDGRYFAGNTVRVRYYPTEAFEAGRYDE